MDAVLQVLMITVPVFALVGLGAGLRRSGFIDDAAAGFATRLVYTFSLPALIFLFVARQDLTRLLDVPVITATVGTTLLTFGLFLGLGRVLGLPPVRRGFLAWTPFWANVSYLGFPLAERAWGDEGLALAAIVNAFAMPLFVVLGMLSLQCHGGREGGLLASLRKAVLNPVVLAAVAGIAVSALRAGLEAAGVPVQVAEWPRLLTTLIALGSATLELLGDMGLPLALIAVGAALRLQALTGDWRLLALASFAKLVLTPALTWGLLWLCFPGASDATVGVAVLLMATPAAVASAVICQQLGRSADDAAANVVATTGLAVVTIPLWLLFLL